MTKYKHYVVWQGRNVGIFDSWQSCKEQIDKFEGAVYKGYATRAEAVEAFEAGMPTFAKHRQAEPPTTNKKNKKAKGEQRNEHKVQQRESGGIWYGCGI